jgi:hypothetical protein
MNGDNLNLILLTIRLSQYEQMFILQVYLDYYYQIHFKTHSITFGCQLLLLTLYYWAEIIFFLQNRLHSIPPPESHD